MEINLRECRESDAEMLASLSGELGYPIKAEEMAGRLRRVMGNAEHTVTVACDVDGSVVGWMDVGVVFHLQSGAYCEIGGLVVAEKARNNRIGQRLLAYAETWAKERGLQKIVVRSNTIREDAHRFYLREKYARVKTSAVFEKVL